MSASRRCSAKSVTLTGPSGSPVKVAFSSHTVWVDTQDKTQGEAGWITAYSAAHLAKLKAAYPTSEVVVTGRRVDASLLPRLKECGYGGTKFRARHVYPERPSPDELLAAYLANLPTKADRDAVRAAIEEVQVMASGSMCTVGVSLPEALRRISSGDHVAVSLPAVTPHDAARLMGWPGPASFVPEAPSSQSYSATSGSSRLNGTANALHHLARRHDLPPQILSWVIKEVTEVLEEGPMVELALLYEISQNSAASPKMLHRVIDRTLTLAARHPSTGARHLGGYDLQSEAESPLASVLKHPRCSLAHVRRIVESGFKDLVAVALQHPAVNSNVLRAAASTTDAYTDIKASLAIIQHPLTPKDVLTKVSQAANAEVSVAAELALAEDPAEFARQVVAEELPRVASEQPRVGQRSRLRLKGLLQDPRTPPAVVVESLGALLTSTASSASLREVVTAAASRVTLTDIEVDAVLGYVGIPDSVDDTSVIRKLLARDELPVDALRHVEKVTLAATSAQVSKGAVLATLVRHLKCPADIVLRAVENPAVGRSNVLPIAVPEGATRDEVVSLFGASKAGRLLAVGSLKCPPKRLAEAATNPAKGLPSHDVNLTEEELADIAAKASANPMCPQMSRTDAAAMEPAEVLIALLVDDNDLSLSEAVTMTRISRQWAASLAALVDFTPALGPNVSELH